jgi:hypothetical protein
LEDHNFYGKLLEEPVNLVEGCYHDGYELSRAQIEKIHLEGARRRFAQLRPRLSVMDRLATEQGIDAIDRIEDLAPLIFPHTIYKSYAIDFVLDREFDRMTRWLGGLSAIDLSDIDMSGVERIDTWLDALGAQTSLQVFHTSGTSGKLSFVPRTVEEAERQVKNTNQVIRDHWGPNQGPDMFKARLPVIVPGYHHGYANTQRSHMTLLRMLNYRDEEALFMYPDVTFSADVASLPSLQKRAQERGGGLEAPEAILHLRDEIEKRERDRPAALELFFENVRQRFGGRNVRIGANWPMLYEWTETGLARGLHHIFGPDSVVLSGGGPKKRNLPDNWRELVYDFLGTRRFYEFYGSSELFAINAKCEAGNYHLAPTLVTFLLDPETGAILPRDEGQTGRLAMFDLLATTYWGGLVTGDQVTISGWNTPCECGRVGPYLHPAIRRYADVLGGEDPLACAGSQGAHAKAFEFHATLSR